MLSTKVSLTAEQLFSGLGNLPCAKSHVVAVVRPNLNCDLKSMVDQLLSSAVTCSRDAVMTASAAMTRKSAKETDSQKSS